MNGRILLIKLAELQKRFPRYISLRWANIIEEILSEGNYTINEISRILILDHQQTFQLRTSMARLKYIGRVWKNGIRFELTGKRTRRYDQRCLEEWLSKNQYKP